MPDLPPSDALPRQGDIVPSDPAGAPLSPSPGRVSPLGLGCLLGGCILGLAFLIASGLIAFAIRESTERMTRAMEQTNPLRIVQTLLPPPTPTVIVRPPALLQVRAISNLATAQALLSTIVEVNQARVGNVIYERLVLIACGRVKAGVDLTQLTEDDVRVIDNGRTVRIKLPAPSLQDAYLIDDSNQTCTTRVYDRTNLLVIPESRELESQAREKALEAIQLTALESGILEEARQNAQLAIERILLSAGYARVEFIE